MILLVACLAIARISGETASCPASCSCDLWLGLRRTRCQAGHLYSVDTAAPRDTQALDLPGNSISVIGNREIADLGLTQLKYLNLSSNAISEIALEAFEGLKDLTVLDLSKNRLRYLLRGLFLGNENLRVLRLSGNYFETHAPVLDSPSITDLSLDFCQIDHLPADTFDGLPQIRSLDLSGNLMIQLDLALIKSLGNLRKISLEGNPWSCDDAARQLRDFLQENDVNFREICPGFPRKFEKIVLAPKKTRKKVQTRISNTTIATESFPKFPTTTAKPRDFPEKLSSRWIFLGGFACGVIVGIAVTTIFLASCLCRRKRRSRNDPQRVSLLANFWTENLRGNHEENWQQCQGNRSRNDENSSRNWWEIFQENHRAGENRENTAFPACPGTPPPAYREVMLRPALYRSPTTPRRGIPSDP